ncbi:hypothetical protein OIU77_016187 [Salix suchowensis]|uniref:Pentatricopeptide repeat-containing protein n=1 Tax=Salix suchowensis TaxID=1278906 RepID=A0ABQ8ZJV7_9ROSI|nr:hypothetical protein OIU77_016187 [Salix suchowensis]
MVRRLKLLVDFVAMVSVLSACSCVSNKAVSEGVGVVMKDGLDKVMGVESTLLDAYIKCGEMNFTGKVFDEMAEKNVVSWNSECCKHPLPLTILLQVKKLMQMGNQAAPLQIALIVLGLVF